MKKRKKSTGAAAVPLNQTGTGRGQVGLVEAAIAEAVRIGSSAGLRFTRPRLRARLLEALAAAEGTDGEEEA